MSSGVMVTTLSPFLIFLLLSVSLLGQVLSPAPPQPPASSLHVAEGPGTPQVPCLSNKVETKPGCQATLCVQLWRVGIEGVLRADAE